jgi:translation initiation factor IF-3
LSRPFSRPQPGQPQHRINGKIRAREVRVIGIDGQQVGIMDLAAAINLARQNGVDLVEIAATAVPPVCRIVDYGMFSTSWPRRSATARSIRRSTS